jgi:murein DD-endopeptidase MepM/ murein hydrolase activator NlpD
MATTNSPRGLITTFAFIVLVIVGTLVTLWWRQNVALPAVQVDRPLVAIGARPQFGLQAQATRGVLTEVSVRIRQGEIDATVFRAEPAERSTQIDVTFELAGHGLREGEAVLEIHAVDDFWRPRSGDGTPSLRLPVTIDLTPPRISLRSSTRYPAAGGAAVAVMSVDGADDVWVQARDRRFRAFENRPEQPGLYFSLYALDIDHSASEFPAVMASDAAGNVTRIPLPVVLRDGKVQTGRVDLSIEWLRTKLPELLPGREFSDDQLADGFVEVSRDQRAEAAKVCEDLARASGPFRTWAGRFTQMPNSRNMSGFGVLRTYRVDGRELHSAVHAGFDFASVQRAPIPAANAGRVVHAGPLTLYGLTVVVDHGWGLLSLYGHCSSIEVSVGDEVAQGQILARTGMTGLAAGDHLHFEMIVDGVPVTPVQWFDAAWIRDHIEGPLREGGLNF